jgi:hypothetical protein
VAKSKQDAFVKNAADPRQVKRGAALEKEQDRQFLQDVKDVMQTKAGRRLVWHIINKMCHIDAVSAVPSGSWTYFNEGGRSVGKELKMAVYEAAFPEWQEMEREHVVEVVEQRLKDK